MSDETVKNTFSLITTKVEQMEQAIKEAERYISFAKRAGEDVTEREKKLGEQKIRLKKWKIALEEQSSGIYNQ